MELDLDAVRDRFGWFDELGVSTAKAAAAWKCAEDVPALVEEVQRLREKLDKPCGECHPCMYWADQTWRAAGRVPPDMPQWDEKIMELAHAEAELEEERRTSATLREQRDRAINELGEVCEERDALRGSIRRIGESALKARGVSDAG